MREKIVAIIGGLLILASALIGLAWAAYWEGTHPVAPNAEEMEIWRVAQNVLGLTPEQALYLSLGGLLLGVVCLIPWWRERRRQETLWYQLPTTKAVGLQVDSNDAAITGRASL